MPSSCKASEYIREYKPLVGKKRERMGGVATQETALLRLKNIIIPRE